MSIPYSLVVGACVPHTCINNKKMLTCILKAQEKDLKIELKNKFVSF